MDKDHHHDNINSVVKTIVDRFNQSEKTENIFTFGCKMIEDPFGVIFSVDQGQLNIMYNVSGQAVQDSDIFIIAPGEMLMDFVNRKRPLADLETIDDDRLFYDGDPALLADLHRIFGFII